MKKMLRNQKFGKKMFFGFAVVMLCLILSMVIAFTALIVSSRNMRIFSQKTYVNSTLQMEMRKDVQAVGKYVLWATNTVNAENTAARVDEAQNCLDAISGDLEKLSVTLEDKQLVERLKKDMKDYNTAAAEVVRLARDNENSVALRKYDENYAPAVEVLQTTLQEIGSYADERASVGVANSQKARNIAFVSLFLIAVFSVVMCIYIGVTLTSIMKKPIEELEEAANNLSNGQLAIKINYKAEDELGHLAHNFRETLRFMEKVIRDASKLLSKMASGDFTVVSGCEDAYVGEFKVLKTSMGQLRGKLHDALIQIDESSKYVAIGASQLSESARELAGGVQDQDQAVRELTVTAEEVAATLSKSAAASQKSYEQAHGLEERAERSNQEMEDLTAAMSQISETSRQIGNIIQEIEDIAAQTNLLSLNAAIEAARAGEAGKGFAVVAEQIRKLADDSAQSAVRTRELIENSIEKIEHGNKITERTSESLFQVIEGIKMLGRSAREASEAAGRQAKEMQEIQNGIEQISTVVASNSAAAQQTSSTSEALTSQAEVLTNLVGRFQL